MSSKEVDYIPPPPQDWTRVRVWTGVGIVLAVLSISISSFFVGVYFYAKALWVGNGQPVPGYLPWVDLWGQWKVVTGQGGGSPKIVPVGGLVYFAFAPCILAILFGLGAAICGALPSAEPKKFEEFLAYS